MSGLNLTQNVPLTEAEDGVVRVSESRITLDSIVHLFQSGATAEQIQEDFPTLTLSQVYSVIAYYLQHKREVDHYLSGQAVAAREVRLGVEGKLGADELRQRLRQRRAQTAAA